MARVDIRRVAIVVAVGLAVAAILIGPSLLATLGPGEAPAVLAPGEPQTVTTNCERDPAPLRPIQTSSNGRPFNYLHTCGRHIYDANGREVKITGINWFGMETGTYAPHGLWTRNWKSILDQIASLGYNTVRLPFSNEALEPGRQPQGINYGLNPDLQGLSSLEMMDHIVEGAQERGLKIVLDRHRPDSNAQSTLWYTSTVSEERWIADWRMLARRYRGNDAVIGVDLHNEPGGEATWGSGDLRTDWRLAAERAGNAVLEENPYLLIFVEGVGMYDGQWYWFGGNLSGAGKYPVRLKVPNRVVYSPHDYGPDIYLQGWFLDPEFPKNLPKVWDSHWGYLQRKNLAPVVMGEFGGRSVGSDREGQWQRSLVDYLRRSGIGYIAWSLNPNSGDTGGLLSDDWETVQKQKQDLYSTYIAPPLANGSGGSFGPPPGKLEVQCKSNAPQERTNNIGFSLRIVNDGPTPLKLSRLEVRYWYTAGDLRGATQVMEVDWAVMGKDYVRGEFVPTSQGGQDHYLRLTFQEGAPAIAPYSSSGDLMLRIHKSDWSDYAQSNDYSFSPNGDFQRSDRITLYLDGKLVWGKEP